MNPKPTLSSSEAATTWWDVVVIGAGISGSIVARETAKAGRRVLLIDKRAFPRRKVCGACLNETSLEILNQLDLTATVQSLGGKPLHQFALHHGRHSVHLPLSGGIALSREALDSALVVAAINAGVEFLDESHAALGTDGPSDRRVHIVRSGHETSVRAGAVVVATGLGDVSAPREGEWTSKTSSSSRIGMGCTVADNSGGYEAGTIWMAAGKGGYVGLVRVEDGQLNVAAAFDRKWIRSQGSPVAATQELLARAGLPLPEALLHADWQGTLPLTRSTTPVAQGRTFLVGDAAGYIEPFTGEGMMWALRSGQHLSTWVVRAVRGEISMLDAAVGWKNEYRRVIQRPQWFCQVSSAHRSF